MKHLITGLSFVLALFLLAPPTLAEQDTDAEQFDNATKAYEYKDYATALKLIRPLAEKGNAKAQYNLGLMYYEGDGVRADLNETFKWYTLAANQGNANAQHGLGYMYEKGYGVKQDYGEAVKWYKFAANQGYGFSQHNLGVMYQHGLSVQQDYVEAMKWFKLAASQHVYESEFNIGQIYKEGGFGIQQDSNEAVKWFKLSAEHGYVNAQYVLGTMYIKGEGVERNLDEAIKYLTPVARQGYHVAQSDLGLAYAVKAGMSGFGPDIPQDKRNTLINEVILAYAWCKIAIQSDSADVRVERLLSDLKRAMKPSEISEAEAKSTELMKTITTGQDSIVWWIAK